MIRAPLAVLAFASLFLSACADEQPADPAPSPTPEESATGEPVSILRPDVEEPGAIVPIEPVNVTLPFLEGAELSDAALEELAAILESRAVKEGGAITLGGHSDAGGNDAVNQRVSQQRADAVKDWLVEQGIAEARITTIAFGEQNPLAPNALPDGSPDEKGRAANRRVELKVAPPSPSAEPTPDPETMPAG